MKHFAKLLSQLSGAALVAAALTGCGRAEYAMLPKTSSYHGTHHAVTVAPKAEAVATPAAPVTPAPVTPAEAPARAAQPVQAATAPAPATAAVQAPARPLSPVQRGLLKKALQKADKLAAKAQVKKHSNASATEQANALNKYVKLGIILLLVGLVVGLVFGFLGYILSLIGVVLIILGLLDSL